MSWFWAGLLLTVAGGAMQGSFTVPQKYLKNWSWELGWLFYSICGMVIFPWLLVAMVIPQPWEVYSAVGFAPLALAAFFGAGWGIGSVFFGLGVAHLGTALAFAIIISLTAALGSLVPLVILHPEQALTARGGLLAVGLLIVIVGVSLCSKAGRLKEQAGQGSGAARQGNFSRGLLICVLSGIASPMMNFALAFGRPISEAAAKSGANPANASIAILAVAISSGFLINAGYCLFLLRRNRSWGKVGVCTARNLAFTAAMGFLWLFGMFFYGLGATRLGELGEVVGWPLFMTVMVVVANLWGQATGEWKNAGTPALRRLAAGNAIMIVALVVIALATKF